MMKISFLLILAACSVHCNVISRYSQKDILSTYLNVAMDIISKANDKVLTGSNNTKIQNQKPSDCADILDMGYSKSGLYEIWPMSRILDKKSFYVYCDMATNGGGWTVIQRRGDFKTPTEYFYRNWNNYKYGFGNIEEDFWLGNDKIFSLTNQKLYSVRFDLRDVNNNTRYAAYDEFWIDDEIRKYTLHIDLYSGDAGDSMAYHNNRVFLTFDKDNAYGCAKKRKSGWWHDNCSYSNLNGVYYKGKYDNSNYDGIHWYHWKGHQESLEWTEIKIRPKHFRATFS